MKPAAMLGMLLMCNQPTKILKVVSTFGVPS